MATHRQKILAQRDRERRLREQEVLDKALASNLKRLKTMTGGFARPGTVAKAGLKRKSETEAQLVKFGPRLQMDINQRLPAKADPIPKVPEIPQYEGDMAERQALAEQRTREMKARVGPVGNKMGPQYMTDSDLADERKGLLRRRS